MDNKPSDNFLTPPVVTERLKKFSGGVNLDPCSHPQSSVEAYTRVFAPWNVHKPTFGTYRDQVGDGLVVSWKDFTTDGIVFCNPPYSKPAPWIQKAVNEGVDTIMLLPASVGDLWWHRTVVPHAVGILLWRGRMKFWQPGVSKASPAPHSARFPVALAAFGAPEFAEELETIFGGDGWFVR